MAKNILTVRDLDRVIWVQTFGPSDLAQRERNTFYLLSALLKIFPHKTQMKVSLGALAATQRRVGLPGSTATVRRALAGLERAGYLRRSHCRIGDDRLGLGIVFNLSRWAYWIERRTAKVIPTSVYVSPCQSMGLDVFRTKIQSTGITSKIDNSSNHARDRSNNFYSYLKVNPVLLTLWVLLRRTPEIRLFTRAEKEVRAIDAGEVLEDNSGIPWEEYARNWSDMLPTVRDTFAKSQILPALRASSSSPAPSSSPATISSPAPSSSPARSSEIRDRILASLDSSRKRAG